MYDSVFARVVTYICRDDSVAWGDVCGPDTFTGSTEQTGGVHGSGIFAGSTGGVYG